MDTADHIFLLEGKVQHYAWGGYDFIPQLLKKENPTQLPHAEYWLGAHESNSSEVLVDEHVKVPLNVFIDADAAKRLGSEVFDRFQKLPFLLKVLDVREMLSIQVHPDKKNAELEFEKENEAGIPLHAPHRNYKDSNHKLELAVAIDELWLLHGFKPAEQLIATLTRIPEFNSFIHIFNVSGYDGLYSHVMELAQPSVNALLQPLVDRVIEQKHSGMFDKSQEDYWAAEAAEAYNRQGNIDRGIFSIYFLNLFKLNQGEAIYQDAGILHAYLEGRVVELMSNSDNVLRGGLTVKHIDIAALMKLVQFKETVPDIIHSEEVDFGISVFKTPSPDFQLKKYALKSGQTINYVTDAIEILLNLEGEVFLQQDDKIIELSSGQSAVIFAHQNVQLKGIQDAIVFSATVETGHVK